MKRILIVSALLCACSSAPELAPDEALLAQSLSRVHKSRAAGMEEAESADSYQVPMRYNPARCDCPRFEFQVYGRWVRAYLAGSPEILRSVESFSERVESGNEVPDTWVDGRITTPQKASKRGIEYPLFEIDAFGVR